MKFLSREVFLKSNALSFTASKELLLGPKNYLAYKNREIERKDSPSLEYGSLLDTIITEEDQFYSRYAITKTTISGKGGEFLKHLAQFDENTPEAIKEAAAKATLVKGIDKVLLDEDNQQYLKEMRDNRGKTVISLDLYNSVLISKSSLREDPTTCKFMFTPELDWEVYNQVCIEFTYQGVLFKGMIDKLIIDHSDKTVYIIDLKSTSFPIAYFSSQVRKYMSDLQITLYTEGVKELFKETHPYYNFRSLFAVTQTTFPYTSEMQQLSVDGIARGRALLDYVVMLKKFYDTNGYNIRYQVASNNGIAIINDLQDILADMSEDSQDDS